MKSIRLGRILVEQGVLELAQIEQALQHQQSTGQPFGLICEQLFQIDPSRIEEAWAAQYARLTRTIDPDIEAYEQRALELITRRQAWQFRILPIRFDGRELMIATTAAHLRRALRFATNVLNVPAFFVIAEPEKLGEALCRRYPMPGLTPASVNGPQRPTRAA